MTKKAFASQLNGSEYPFSLNSEEKALVEHNGFLVVYGASDDLVEFEGLFRDEDAAPGVIMIDRDGVIPSFETFREREEDEDEYLNYFERRKHAKTIEAVWQDEGNPCWTYKTDLPHELFAIMDEGEVYCMGMVIDTKDIQ